ncbi:MAG TPA: hypothetical protein VGE11_06985 [Pseudonocardia sp.]
MRRSSDISARTESVSALAAARAFARISAASSSAACKMFCIRSVNVPIMSGCSPRGRGAGRARAAGGGGRPGPKPGDGGTSGNG